MRAVVLALAVAFAGCDWSTERVTTRSPLPTFDLAQPAAPADLATPTQKPTCEQSVCEPASNYCYLGDETVFYVMDGGNVVGCNPSPPSCKGQAPSCACVLEAFNPGFCVCDESTGIVSVRCSTI